MTKAMSRREWDELTDDTRYDLYTLAHDERIRYLAYQQAVEEILYMWEAGFYPQEKFKLALDAAKRRLFGLKNKELLPLGTKVRHVVEGDYGYIWGYEGMSPWVHWDDGTTVTMDPSMIEAVTT